MWSLFAMCPNQCVFRVAYTTDVYNMGMKPSEKHAHLAMRKTMVLGTIYNLSTYHIGSYSLCHVPNTLDPISLGPITNLVFGFTFVLECQCFSTSRLILYNTLI